MIADVDDCLNGNLELPFCTAGHIGIAERGFLFHQGDWNAGLNVLQYVG